MAGLLRMGVVDPGARGQAADLLQGAGDRRGVARELHRGGVAQELALPGHRALDEPAEEDADAADGHEGQAEHGDLAAAALLAAAAVAAAAGRAAQYPVADH